MQEYDNPLTLELRTEREVAMLLNAVGMGAAFHEDMGMLRGATALQNLQIRFLTEYEPEAIDALNRYDMCHGVASANSATGGRLQKMSPEAAVSQIAAEEEQDPDSINDGGL